MCVKEFCAFLPTAKFSKNDKRWFPRWIRRYAESVNVTDGPLPVTEDLVIRFLRSLRDHAVPAWQRLQAVRAVEAYRRLVLRTDVPCLQGIRQTLSRLAGQEKTPGLASGRPGVEDERHLIGVIDQRKRGHPART